MPFGDCRFQGGFASVKVSKIILFPGSRYFEGQKGEGKRGGEGERGIFKRIGWELWFNTNQAAVLITSNTKMDRINVLQVGSKVASRVCYSWHRRYEM